MFSTKPPTVAHALLRATPAPAWYLSNPAREGGDTSDPFDNIKRTKTNPIVFGVAGPPGLPTWHTPGCDSIFAKRTQLAPGWGRTSWSAQHGACVRRRFLFRETNP